MRPCPRPATRRSCPAHPAPGHPSAHQVRAVHPSPGHPAPRPAAANQVRQKPTPGRLARRRAGQRAGRITGLMAAVLLLLATTGCHPQPAAAPAEPGDTPTVAPPLDPPQTPGPETPAAPLRVAVHPQAQSWAATLAAEWQDRWPELAVALIPADDPAGALDSGTAELALIPGRPGERPTEPPPGLMPPGGRALVVGWEYGLYTAGYLAPESLEALPAPAGGPSGTPAAPWPAPVGQEPLPALSSFAGLQWGQVLRPVAGILPTPESIAGGSYPAARPVWLVVGPAAKGWQGSLPLSGLLATTGDLDRALARSGLARSEPPRSDPDGPGGGPSRPVTLAAVGDVMLARGVAGRMRQEGPDYPVALVAGRLAAADLTLGNLESPIGRRGRPIPGKQIWFRADPTAVQALTRAGFDLLTVANNHTLDYDLENFAETLERLHRAGIDPVGGGPDLAAARAPVIREVAGLRFAFLGYSQFAHLFWSQEYPLRFAATADRAGVAPLDESLLAQDIPRAAAQADVVVVTVHWGEEGQNHPTPDQVRLARRMAELGADLILGHHPHAVQGIEVYNGALIAYSMGNFIMDDESLGPRHQESMLLEFTWYPGGGQTVRVTPARISGFRPAFLEGAEARAALVRLRELSAEIPPPAD